MKQITFAIAGCGARGQEVYAACLERFPDRMKIVAAADQNEKKLQQMRTRFGLTPDACFPSAETMLQAGRLADVLVIATPDRSHYAEAMAALKLGYHLLLEKPVAVTEQQCRDIEAAALKYQRQVVVCHVLRYTAFYQKLKELIDSGTVGEPVSIQAIERVGYWHQAHSFVRGNWRNSALSTPMFLQKCCHDMDIVLWLMGKRCERVSSFGSLRHFTPENAPQGASDRCVTCQVAGCPYNALDFYLSKDPAAWPAHVLTTDHTREGILAALEAGPYGRCVYHCDNDVVDHQVVNLELEGGATVNFTMCAFTQACARHMRIMGTGGEIIADMQTNLIDVYPFGGQPEHIDVHTLTDDFSGHGGGDVRMVKELLDLVSGQDTSRTALTSITQSVESHLVALAAEASRLDHGRVVEL